MKNVCGLRGKKAIQGITVLLWRREVDPDVYVHGSLLVFDSYLPIFSRAFLLCGLRIISRVFRFGLECAARMPLSAHLSLLRRVPVHSVFDVPPTLAFAVAHFAMTCSVPVLVLIVR